MTNTGNLKRRTLSGLAKMSASSIFIFAIQFVTTIVLARIFSPDQFGIVSAITIITSYTDILWMLGIGPALVQKKEISQKDIDTGFTVSIGLGLIATLIVAILSPYLSKLINIDDSLFLQVISLSFIISSFGMIPISLLQREMKFNKIVKKDIYGSIGYTIIALTLGLCGMGVWALVLATMGRYIISTIVSWISCTTKFNIGFDLKSFRSLVRFGGGYTLSKLFNVTASQGDYFVITRTLGTYSLGIYNRAYQLLAIPANIIGQVIDIVFFPALSKIQDQNDRMGKIYIFSTAAIGMLYFPISVILFLFSEEIVFFLLGSQWMDAVTPLKILGLTLFFRVGYKINDPVLRSKGIVYNRAFIQFIYAVMVVVFSYVGSFWGIIGVSVGVAFALIANYIFLVVLTQRIIRFNFIEYLQCVLPLLTSTLIISILLELIKNTLVLHLSKVFVIIILLLLLTSMFILMFSLIYVFVLPHNIKKEFQELIIKLFMILKRKKISSVV